MSLDKLPLDQQEYLLSRGFTVLNGLPRQNESYPYLVLHPLRRDRPSMEYVHGQFSHANFGWHPETTATSQLVHIIHTIAGEHMRYDGDIFTTTPGVPIKVFKADQAWDDVTKLLVKEVQP